MSGYVVCPYCDPNYKPYPNVDEACRGYDVPMGNPIPAQGKTDPGDKELKLLDLNKVTLIFRNP